MYYSHAIEILDNFEAGIYTEDDVMKAIDKILSMETINAVRKDLLLKALRFARQRIDWDDYWNNAKPIRAESTDNEYDDNYICPACGNETLVYGQKHCEECGKKLNWGGRLKEQKTKLVEIDGQLGGIKYGRCPKCGKGLNEEVYPRWCGFCGQAVKWDG